MTGAPLSCRKSLFTLPDGMHFLNCAYMGPLPASTQEKGVEGVRRKGVPTRIAAPDFFSDSNELRARFARAVGASDRERVAIIPSVSYGVAIAARNLPCARGQNVVVVDEQFPSNVYAWRRLARSRGASMRTVAAPSALPPRSEGWNAALLEAIDRDTAVVALPQVHWTDGTRFDLAAIGRRAREVGAALVVDGSQSVGALRLDVTEIRPDAVVCAGYKWLLGPYSLAFAWLGPRFDDGEPLEENWIGREDSEDFQGLVRYRDAYQPGALRYDVGERSNFILVPMALESLGLVLEWGPDRIQAYCDRLLAHRVPEIEALGFRVEPRTGRAAHLFGMQAPEGTELGALAAALEARNVHASLRGPALRVSPNVYNDEADVEALVGALREAVGAARVGATT